MARTVTAIKAEITAGFMANETMAAFYGYAIGSAFENTFSKLSFESILFYVIATAIFVVESLFDVLQTNVDSALQARLTHNRQWYVNLSKSFQYGDAINESTGSYDTIDETKQIIAHASVTETEGVLFIKLAKENDGELAALTDLEKNVFENYMREVKDAGVRINIVTGPGDDLILVLNIFYDPLVVDANGKLLVDSGQEPAKDAILVFIKNLPFNGEFIPASLTDALQVTKGVKIPVILSCQTKYGTNDYVEVDGKVVPEYGYLKISDDNLTINYRPYDAN